MQARPHRRADGFAIERIAAGWTEHHDVGAERGGVAKDAADVIRVADAFEHDGQTRLGERRFQRERERTLDERQASPVEVVAGDADEVGGLTHENRRTRGEGRRASAPDLVWLRR